MATPLTGQAAGAGLSTPVALSAVPVSCTAFVLKAPLSNQQAVYIGSSSVSATTGHQLDPGDELGYELLAQNGQPRYQLLPSDFWMVGVAGDRVSWLASP